MLLLLIGKVLLLKYLALIPLKYWGLVSGQFVARCSDRKTVRSWHPYRVTKSMSRVASKRSYTGSYPYFSGGCDKKSWAFKFRGQLNVYLAVLASDFRVCYCACSPAGWFVWPSCYALSQRKGQQVNLSATSLAFLVLTENQDRGKADDGENPPTWITKSHLSFSSARFSLWLLVPHLKLKYLTSLL